MVSKDEIRPRREPKKPEPAYLGGLASVGASIICHPLDTVKVQLQTQKHAKLGFFRKWLLFPRVSPLVEAAWRHSLFNHRNDRNLDQKLRLPLALQRALSRNASTGDVFDGTVRLLRDGDQLYAESSQR